MVKFIKLSRRIFRRGAFILLAGTFVSGCYYFEQGNQLISIYSKAQKIDKLLASGTLSEDEQNFLLLVKEIKKFAVTELGLKENKNYTTYVKIEKDYLADVVSACASDSFKQYKWNYLFMGDMPYMGFFKKEDAAAEAKRLLTKGYDVYARQVDAFSTLGFFSDPIFSYMKNYSIFNLADMLIHEQMHATLFLKPYVDFSENMANFIGEQGSLLFMKKKFGEKSAEYTESVHRLEDSKVFNRLFFNLFEDLDKLYKSDLSREEKLAKKEQIIAAWKEKYISDYELNFQTRQFKRFPEGTINNAVLCTMMNYTNSQSVFYDLFLSQGSDLVKTIGLLKEITSKGTTDPVLLIQQFLHPTTNSP